MTDSIRWQLRSAIALGLWVGACSSQAGARRDAAATPRDEPRASTRAESTRAASTRERDALGVTRQGRAACPLAVATGAHPQLTDFETNAQTIAHVEGRGGYWFYYHDGSEGRLRHDVVEQASRVLRVSSSGWTGWGSGFGVSLSAASTRRQLCPYDASAYTGLSFRVRGRGSVRLRLATPTNTPVTEGGQCAHPGVGCYDWPGTWLQLTEGWQTHDIPFCALRPEGWSGSAPALDLTQLGGIHFRLRGDVELWLDDLKFTRDGHSMASSRAPSPTFRTPASPKCCSVTRRATPACQKVTTASCGGCPSNGGARWGSPTRA